MVYFEDYIFYSFDRDLFDSSRIFLICVFSEFERIEIYYMWYEIIFFRFFLKVEIYLLFLLKVMLNEDREKVNFMC